MSAKRKRRWRDYRTSSGRRPIKEFIDSLSDGDAAAVVAAMRDVAETGLPVARHFRREIYEVRADGDRQAFRVLFATEGSRDQILLSLRRSRRRRSGRHQKASGSPSAGLQTGAVAARDRLSHVDDLMKEIPGMI